jgi:hypothetical protein
MVRTLFVNTETTPNANSLKFLPGREVLPENFGTGMYFQRNENREINKSPLAKALFSESGVKGVFLGRDFITITKDTETTWHNLRPAIFSLLFDFFSSENVVIDTTPVIQDTTILDTDSEIVMAIKVTLISSLYPIYRNYLCTLMILILFVRLGVDGDTCKTICSRRWR